MSFKREKNIFFRQRQSKRDMRVPGKMCNRERKRKKKQRDRGGRSETERNKEGRLETEGEK